MRSSGAAEYPAHLRRTKRAALREARRFGREHALQDRSSAPVSPSDRALERARAIYALEQVAIDELRKAVEEARRHGASWTDVAAALGVTRQAAHTRFR